MERFWNRCAVVIAVAAGWGWSNIQRKNGTSW
jgi:hypothetical protein